MKKTLLSFFLLFAWMFSWHIASANGGPDCSSATVATQGVNHCDHAGVVDQWFTYTVTSDCILTITSCGYTTSATEVNIINSCSFPYVKAYNTQCGSTAPYQSNLVYKASAGEVLLIRWSSLGAAASYDWSLTEAPLPVGSTAETAIPAVEGINNTNHYGSTIDQWYFFTPNVSGLMTITNVEGLTNGKYIAIYAKEDNKYIYITSVSNYSEFSQFLTAGVTYYICWQYAMNPDFHSWRLTFSPRAAQLGDACNIPIVASLGQNSASNEVGAQWFTYTPTADGMATVSTCGLTQEDTYVEIYKDCNSQFIADNDDFCDHQASVAFPVVKGQPYLIKWKNTFTSGTYSWNLSLRNYSTETNITSFEFPNKTLSSTIDANNHAIAVTVGKNEDISALIPTFTLTDGAHVSVGGLVQESGIDGNNFTSPVVYTVMAEDSTTTTDWTVTVTNASNESGANDILSYTFDEPTDSTVIDAVNHTITGYIPSNQNITTLTANFALSIYANASIGATPQVSRSTVNDFTSPVTYTVTAEDGTTQDWVVTVVQNAQASGETCSDPIVAVEGENHANYDYFTQYFIYTPTEDGVIGISYCGTSNYYYNIYSDCSTMIASNYLKCGMEDKYAVQAGVPVIVRWTDIAGDSWHLTKYGVSSQKQLYYFRIQGSIGYPSVNEANHSLSCTVNPTVDLSKLKVVFDLSIGATAYIGTTQIFNNDTLDFTGPVTITVKAQDGSTQDYVVVVTKRALGTGNSLNAFLVNNQEGNTVIDVANHTVKVGVVAGTDRTMIFPRFGLSDYASASIGGNVQSSGKNVVDFTNPVTYTITSEAGDAQDWTVTVVEGAEKNIYADITSFRLDEQTQQSVIDEADKTILTYVANGIDRSTLIPTFYLSTGATAKVGATPQQSGVTANDFTAPVVYSVTSEDGLTTTDWTITVSVINGIADNTLASNANVFPNPSNGQFSVELNMPVSGKIQMDVFSVTGAKVLSQTVDGSKGMLSVDLSSYSTGIYYLRMRMNGKTVTLKLLRN